MGTFRARFRFTVDSGPDHPSLNGSGDDAFYSYGSGAPFTGTLNWDLQGDCFYLDGSSIPISFAGLPSGFTPTGIQALTTSNTDPSFWGGNPDEGSTADIAYGFNFGATPGSSIVVTFGTYSRSIALTNTGHACLMTCNNLTFTNAISLTGTLHIQSTCWDLTNTYVTKTIDLVGSYTIIQTQYTLQNASTPIHAGDKIKVTSASGRGLDQVETVRLNYTDDAGLPVILDLDWWYWILFEPDEFWFYMPPIKKKTPTVVTITFIFFDGTEFSGSVAIGSLTVLFADVSGIYQLEQGQTSDILYFRSGITTDIELLYLQFFLDDEVAEEDSLYYLLTYPRKVLSLLDVTDDSYDSGFDDYMIFSVTQAIAVPLSVEIPSPFAITAFLP